MPIAPPTGLVIQIELHPARLAACVSVAVITRRQHHDGDVQVLGDRRGGLTMHRGQVDGSRQAPAQGQQRLCQFVGAAQCQHLVAQASGQLATDQPHDQEKADGHQLMRAVHRKGIAWLGEEKIVGGGAHDGGEQGRTHGGAHRDQQYGRQEDQRQVGQGEQGLDLGGDNSRRGHDGEHKCVVTLPARAAGTSAAAGVHGPPAMERR